MAFGSEETAVLKLEVESQAAEQALGRFGKAVAALVAVETIRRLADLAEAGDRINDVYAATPISVTKAKDAINGTVSVLNLSIQANRAAAAGLSLTSDSFRNITVVAKQFADRTGIETTDAIEQLTSALIRGSQRGLKPFGIEADNTAEALAAVDEKARGVTVGTEGTGGAVARLKVAFEELGNSIAAALDDDDGLGAVVNKLADVVEAMNKTTTSAGHLQNAFDRMLVAQLGRDTGAVNDENAAFFRRIESAPRVMGAAGASFGGRQQNVQEEAGAGGGGTRSDPIWARLEARRRAVEEAQQLEANLARAELEIRISQAQASIDTEQAAADSRSRSREREYDQWSRMMRNRHREEMRLRRESDIAEREATRRVDEQQASYADLAQATLQAGFASIMAGKSAKEALKGILEAVAMQAAQRALFEAAEAVAAAASMRYDQAAEHAVAAGMFGAIALGAGAGAAGVSRIGGTDRSAAERVASGRGGGTPGGGTMGGGGDRAPITVTVVVDAAGGVIRDHQLRQVGAYLREAQRRGYAPGGR